MQNSERMAKLVQDMLDGQGDAAEMIDELMHMKTIAYACGVLFAMERACESVKATMKVNGADPDFLIECLRQNDDSMIATVVFDTNNHRETNQ